MPDVNRGNRPLSPFMLGQYYRLQLTSVTSLINRVTGSALILGGLLLVWWLLAAATSADSFAIADGVITSWFGDLVMTLSLWALWFHALAGLRHLYWDSGRGLDVAFSEKLGIAIIVLSVVLTIATIICV